MAKAKVRRTMDVATIAWIVRDGAARALLLAMAICLAGAPLSTGQSAGTQNQPAPESGQSPDDGDEILIHDKSPLPDTFPRATYSYRFTARGGTPPQRWKLESGALPPGLKLDDDGLLHGSPERAGEFRFIVSVAGSAGNKRGVQKEFVLRVTEAITLNWKTPAHVAGGRIEGSVEVSNTTANDMDLTYVVMAVSENGRATAIGYQRFVLRGAGTTMELPFGENLPHGGYVVHVDVVGEVAKTNTIYRQRLQTPAPLQVVVGP
jgi:hypothetical protein